MKPKPLLILFANLKGNLGDFAILHAMLIELEKRYPDRGIDVVTHGQHGVDEPRFEAFRKHVRTAFAYKGRTPFTRVPKWMSVFKRIGLGQWLSRRLTDRLTVEYAAKFPASEAGDYEAVFFAGGEQWSGYSNGITMLSVLLAVSKSNKNLSIFPFSVKKKLLEFHSLPLLQSCFSRFVGKLVVRDSHSGEIVRRFAPAVVNGADCVFSLADEALPLPPAPGRNADAVMLAVTTGNGSRLPDLTATIRALQGAGFRVRLLTTCEREDGEDLRRLGRELGVEALAPATWQETVSEFKSSAMVVTNRLHCMIFTLFADVPLVPLLNREKVVGIHHDAELPHALRHSAELTPAKVRECLGDAGLIRAKMSVYLEKVLRSELSP